jgi:RNA polymerase sigma factor (sigma-70 family)
MKCFGKKKLAEESFLVKIGAGDRAAVSGFVDRYGSLLWSLALRFSKNAADAEDAVQEVFIELWRSAHRFDPTIASEATFVSMVARRKLIDRSRKKKIDLVAYDNLDYVVENTNDGAMNAEFDDEVKKAVSVLDQLPSEQCKTIRLSIFDGLSHSQIADKTGLSLGTVKTHIRRGLITIRERIGASSTIQPEGGVA